MTCVLADVRLIQLAQLDVIDVRPGGGFVLNGRFLMECRDALAARPSILDSVIGSHIVDRAIAHGMASEIDPLELTLAALEIGCADADAR